MENKDDDESNFLDNDSVKKTDEFIEELQEKNIPQELELLLK